MYEDYESFFLLLIFTFSCSNNFLFLVLRIMNIENNTCLFPNQLPLSQIKNSNKCRKIHSIYFPPISIPWNTKLPKKDTIDTMLSLLLLHILFFHWRMFDPIWKLLWIFISWKKKRLKNSMSNKHNTMQKKNEEEKLCWKETSIFYAVCVYNSSTLFQEHYIQHEP